jgi:hypothetical protein
MMEHMGRRRWLAVAVLLTFGVACGLSAVGTARVDPTDSPPDAAVSADGSGTTDAGGDGATVDGAADAPPDTTVGCPGTCNGGCDAGACIIECNSVADCPGNVVCPGGLPCVVRCTAADRCSNKTINCPPITSCRIECIADNACQTTTFNCGAGACRLVCGNPHSNACNGATINAAANADFCMSCDGPNNDPGCNGLTCAIQALTCKKHCSGLGCNSIGNCDDCANVTACP